MPVLHLKYLLDTYIQKRSRSTNHVNINCFLHEINIFPLFSSSSQIMSLNKASKSQSKPYRERHQPQDRNHLGLLEKKKDYKLRADDYNNKKQVLKHLRKKALNKNPDEFYFHMTNSKTVDGGIHRDLVSEKTKSATANTTDQIRLMQTQDYKYVSMRRVMEQRKIEKLKGALHLLDADTTSNYTTEFFLKAIVKSEIGSWGRCILVES